MVTDKRRDYAIGDEPVPGYRIQAFLGEGGWGRVWRTSAPGGIEVALKIMNMDMVGAKKEHRSLGLVKKVRHTNLASIHAIWRKDAEGNLLDDPDADDAAGNAGNGGPEPAELIVVMGLGDKTLETRFQECVAQGLVGVPLDELLRYMEGAALAIDFLNAPRHDLEARHQAIQHCDIKPANILIVGDMAQVCDFGLARKTDDARKTKLLASPMYMAPELLETELPSSATDQYSLALSYVEMRTGRLFSPDASVAEVFRAHLDGSIDLSLLSPPERAVIRRALAKKPEDRFPSAHSMVTALRAATVPPAPKAGRWARRIALIGVALLVAAVLAIRPPAVPPPPPPATPTLALPVGFAPTPDTPWLTVGGVSCPMAIMCAKQGLTIPFRLVDGPRCGTVQGDPMGSFYIMENKVTNGQFAVFARAHPLIVTEDSHWRSGALAGGVSMPAAEHPDLPVFGVTSYEAGEFARWLGGRLPSARQWDAAAGRFAPGERTGPFRAPAGASGPPDVSCNRQLEGPMDAGKATDDVSEPFEIRDMAGNGREWTSTPRDGAKQFELDRDNLEKMSIVLRGRSYLDERPLEFRDLDDAANSPDFFLGGLDAYHDTGFRVVVVVDGLR